MGPGGFFALFEVRMIEALLRSPTWHRFVGNVHKRYRWMKEGKTQEEIMEEMGGTNDKRISEEGRMVLFKHFRDEINNQWREISRRGGGPGNKLK